jgi:hypothetical protein
LVISRAFEICPYVPMKIDVYPLPQCRALTWPASFVFPQNADQVC